MPKSYAPSIRNTTLDVYRVTSITSSVLTYSSKVFLATLLFSLFKRGGKTVSLFMALFDSNKQRRKRIYYCLENDLPRLFFYKGSKTGTGSYGTILSPNP